MEMEGIVYSDFYRNTSEEIFIRTLMGSSVGVPAPTITMFGFKNLSNSFRADSEELFKSWLTTAENQGHDSTGLVHNHPRQLSRMLAGQTSLLSHQNGVPSRSYENLTHQCLSEVGEHSVSNSEERGLQASNLNLAKAWFNSSQPMTRSRSSELRRKYAAMQNSQTAIGIEAMNNASGIAVNESKQDFISQTTFDEAFGCDIPNQYNGLISTSTSSSSTIFNVPHLDKVSSVVSILKGTLERKKLVNHKERTFQDLTSIDTDDPMSTQGLEGDMDADMESFVAPTNLVRMNVVSPEPLRSESSAAAPVFSTGFNASDGPSNSGQSPSVCGSPRKKVGNGRRTGNGCVAKGDGGDPTKKRRVERSRKMAEAKERTQTPATSVDMQTILKRCENLEKEVRSLKLNLAFMNRKDSEQTKHIEDLQKQNEDMGVERELLLDEIERILSRQDKI